MSLFTLLILGLLAILLSLILLRLFNITDSILLPELKYIVPVVIMVLCYAFYINYITKKDHEKHMVKNAVLHNLPLPPKYDSLVDQYEYKITKEQYESRVNKDIIIPNVIDINKD